MNMLTVKGYNGRSEGAKFVHKAILLVSDPITHVELYDESSGLSFSSEFGIGPRWKKIGYSHPDRWPEEYTFSLRDLTDEQEDRIRRKCDAWAALRQAGLVGYDTRGAIGCTLTGSENPADVFCSEVVFDVIAGGLDLSKVLNHKLHPMKLVKILKSVLK